MLTLKIVTKSPDCSELLILVLHVLTCLVAYLKEILIFVYAKPFCLGSQPVFQNTTQKILISLHILIDNESFQPKARLLFSTVHHF